MKESDFVCPCCKRTTSNENEIKYIEKFQREIEKQKAALANLEQAANQKIFALKLKMQKDKELVIAEKEIIIKELVSQLDKMKEIAESRSQRIQGESLEVYLEKTLMKNKLFASDIIEEVGKFKSGVDIILKINNSNLEHCGNILIEAKKYTNTPQIDKWVTKLKEDRISVHNMPNAIGIIVSDSEFNDTILIDKGDSIYIVKPQYLTAILLVLKNEMINLQAFLSTVEASSDTKEQIYSYVSSGAFKQKLTGIIDKMEEIKSHTRTIHLNTLEINNIVETCFIGMHEIMCPLKINKSQNMQTKEATKEIKKTFSRRKKIFNLNINEDDEIEF